MAKQPKDLILAFEVIIPLARQGILKADSPDMAHEAARRRAAVDTVEDFLTNNWEDLEDFLEERGGQEVLMVDGRFPEPDLGSIRAMTADPRADAMATMFDLACQQFYGQNGVEDDTILTGSDGEEIEAGTAINLAAAFWLTHGDEVRSEITEIVLPEDFFADSDGPEV